MALMLPLKKRASARPTGNSINRLPHCRVDAEGVHIRNRLLNRLPNLRIPVFGVDSTADIRASNPERRLWVEKRTLPCRDAQHSRSGAPRFDALSHNSCSKCTHQSLLDYLTRLQQKRWGNPQAQCLGGLEVDDELELGWLLDREVSRSGPLQDLIDVGGGASVQVWVIRPIGHEASSLDELPGSRHGRQPALACQAQDLFPVGPE